jgi:hypothetical protein
MEGVNAVKRVPDDHNAREVMPEYLILDISYLG